MTTSSSAAAPGIILLGVPRTGTTLLRRLLNAHPDICCPGETFLLASAARFMRPDLVSDDIEYGVLGGLAAAGLPRKEILESLRGLVEDSFHRVAARANKPRWASKTAIDAFYVSEIETLMAGRARFVCIVRHGLDTALSLGDLCVANEVYVREIHDYIVRDARPLVAFARLWSVLTANLLEFAERHPADAILLRYEDLVSQPVAALNRLATFLGLERGSLDAKSLACDAPSGLGDWKTYSTAGISIESVGRWKSLGAASLHRLAPIVNPVLVRAGYEPVAPGTAPDPEKSMRRYEITLGIQAKRIRDGDPDRG